MAVAKLASQRRLKHHPIADFATAVSYQLCHTNLIPNGNDQTHHEDHTGPRMAVQRV